MSAQRFQELVDRAIHLEEEVTPTVRTQLAARRAVQWTNGRSDVEGGADHTLIFHQGGSNLVTQFDGRRTVSSHSRHGDVTLLAAHQPTGWLMPEPVDVLHVFIDAGRLGGLAAETLEVDPATVEIVSAFARSDAALAQIARSLLGEIASPDPMSGLLLDQYETLIGVHLLRSYTTLPEARGDRRAGYDSTDPRIRRAMDYVEAHTAEPITLAEIAGVAGISRFHFVRVFREATGSTPHRYVQTRRVERAKVLLATDTPLIQIAFACGFASHSHFGQVFKQHTGMTPGEWREGTQ